jgi:hypothetical protein
MCDCLAKVELINKELHQQLKKAICLLKNYIYTLKVSARMDHHSIGIIIPHELLALVKNLLSAEQSKCSSECCGCHKNQTNLCAKALYKIVYLNQNKCDKKSKTDNTTDIKKRKSIYDICKNDDKKNNDLNEKKGETCLKCCIEQIYPSCAVYCNPHTLEVIGLSRKDIIPFIGSNNYVDSIDLLIAKYEGFINFFEKVCHTINGTV